MSASSNAQKVKELLIVAEETAEELLTEKQQVCEDD
jgi:hypothetical protein